MKAVNFLIQIATASLVTYSVGMVSAHACVGHDPSEPITIHTPKCVSAKPSTTKPVKTLITLNEQSAEVKRMGIINPTKAKLVLDFVEVFDTGKEEYKRYLKLGYPKISQAAFDAKAPGGLHVVNQNKQLRTFYTTANTVFKAHCTSSPLADKEGQVELTAKEFQLVLDDKNGTPAERQALKQKHHGCYSQNNDLVMIGYRGKHIHRIAFQWTP